jgi:hypothetical protein
MPASTLTKSRFNKPIEEIQAPLTLAAPNFTALLGTWTNVNPATRDLVKIVLTESHGTLLVHAFGACSPTPCDWGVVTAQAYSASVSGGPTVAFTANYAFGFKSTILTGHLDGGHLIVDDFNVFHDGSGRSAYFSQDTMKK